MNDTGQHDGAADSSRNGVDAARSRADGGPADRRSRTGEPAPSARRAGGASGPPAADAGLVDGVSASPPPAPSAGPADPSAPSATLPAEEDGARLAESLRALLMRLTRRLRREADPGLTPTLTSALVTIERQGPLTLGELAAAESVRPPGVTRTIAALERAGLVARQVDERDRRVWRVSITAAGRDTLAAARSRKTAYLAARLDSLTGEERAALRAALPVLQHLLDEDR